MSLNKIEWNEHDQLLRIEQIVTAQSTTLVEKVVTLYNISITYEEKQTFDDKHIVAYVRWLYAQPHHYTDFIKLTDQYGMFRKIELIKHVRMVFGVGLREAKEAVEKVSG